MTTGVRKRTGEIVDFEVSKIVNAVTKAMAETVDSVNEDIANTVADCVQVWYEVENRVVTVEELQETVLLELKMIGREDVMKVYDAYRKKRNLTRKEGSFKLLDTKFISDYKHRKSNMNHLGEFVFYRTYSRYIPEENRREYWWETARRAVEYNCSIVPTSKEEAQQLYDNVYNLKQFLSGRTFWVGGTNVANKYPMANFNCAFKVVDELNAFVELLYLLMLGSGVGLRITKPDIEKLPSIRTDYQLSHIPYKSLPKHSREETTTMWIENRIATIIVGDSKDGWVKALENYLMLVSDPRYKNIVDIVFNYNSVRPSGEKLKTFGGTASGHEAFKEIIVKIDKIFKASEPADFKVKLRPIDCLDIVTIIGEGVVVGGVRRTAEMILLDSDDEQCIDAKSNLYTEVDGEWVLDKSIGHRSMSNNSIFYGKRPTRERLHWQIEKMRYSGEPAFVNKEAGLKRRDNLEGLNPCVEVLLDDEGMCNLTTTNVMGFVVDGCLDVPALLEAQRLSARAGYRMTCLNLEIPRWNEVQQRDKLIGCSLTGWQDMVNATNMSFEDQKKLLAKLREVAHDAVKEYAKELGMNEPLLTTTVKPEGTLSKVAGVSSGVHYSHSKFYIQRVRVTAKDPIALVCEELGYPISPENGQTWEDCKTKVIEFPMKAPEGTTKYDVSAIQQLENYRMFMTEYVDHNCSITVHVRSHEWDDVEQWLWDNWDDVVGVSFLALDDSFYEQMPFEAISEEEYNRRVSEMKPFIPSLISKYEVEETELDVGEADCASGACPLR